MDVFWGKVKKGKQRGKDLGFPTANIPVHKKLEEGIYVAKIRVGAVWYNGLTFVGKAVTFNETTVQAESYLLDYSGNLYGKYITVQLLKKIRDNQKFSSTDALIKQMNNDVLVAGKFFAKWC